MSELKDKLSTSVRQAKGTLRTKTENPVPEAPPADKSTTSKSTTSKSNTKTAVQPDAASTSANNIPESHNTLFPDRIWPD
jgi:hypothetical protein